MTELKSGLYVLSLRELRIQSTSGHCVHIKSQTPTRIPEALRYEAYAMGCVECDSNGRIGESGEGVATEQPSNKGQTLEEVLLQIYVEGEVENLDTTGVPKVAFVNSLLGEDEPKVNKDQIIRSWLKISADQGVLEEEGLA